MICPWICFELASRTEQQRPLSSILQLIVVPGGIGPAHDSIQQRDRNHRLRTVFMRRSVYLVENPAPSDVAQQPG